MEAELGAKVNGKDGGYSSTPSTNSFTSRPKSTPNRWTYLHPLIFRIIAMIFMCLLLLENMLSTIITVKDRGYSQPPK